MKSLRSSWFPILLGLVSFLLILQSMCTSPSHPKETVPDDNPETWQAPDINLLPATAEGDLIRYGRELIVNTSEYLGPRGTVARITNGMNCQNCHVEGGTRLFGSPLISAASTYPIYRDRSGRIESLQFRVNECLERSLNGEPIDSLSHEMKAIIAYLHWIGKDIQKGMKIPGMAGLEIPFLNRAADPEKGKVIFEGRCQNCHGSKGEGIWYEDSSGYRYPPLWGQHSYNVSAGLFRLLRLASFIKYNMPFTAIHVAPQLSDEESWDVAAYIASQPRTEKFFNYDWMKLSTKPVDLPFGPYTDEFSEQQHKFGPFRPIVEAREKARASSQSMTQKSRP